MRRLSIFIIIMAVCIIVLLGSAMGITVSSLYAFSNDRTLSADQNSNVAAPGWINVTKQRTDEVIRQSSGNKNKVEATMERADDKLSDKVAEDQADKPKADLKKKSGGSDSSRAGSSATKQEMQEVIGENQVPTDKKAVDLGEAGTILNNMSYYEGSLKLDNGKTIHTGRDDKNKPFFYVTDSDGNKLIEAQPFTYSGSTTSYDSLYSNYSDAYTAKANDETLYDEAYNGAYNMFLGQFNSLFYNSYSYAYAGSCYYSGSSYNTYIGSDEDSTYMSNLASTYADYYASSYCSFLGSIYASTATVGERFQYNISDISTSSDGSFELTLAKNYETNRWSADDLVRQASDYFKGAFNQAFGITYNPSGGFYSEASNRSASLLMNYYAYERSKVYYENLTERTGYWTNFFANYNGPASSLGSWASSIPYLTYMPTPSYSGSTTYYGSTTPSGSGSTTYDGSTTPSGSGSTTYYGSTTPSGSGSTTYDGSTTPSGSGSTTYYGSSSYDYDQAIAEIRRYASTYGRQAADAEAKYLADTNVEALNIAKSQAVRGAASATIGSTFYPSISKASSDAISYTNYLKQSSGSSTYYGNPRDGTGKIISGKIEAPPVMPPTTIPINISVPNISPSTPPLTLKLGFQDGLYHIYNSESKPIDGGAITSVFKGLIENRDMLFSKDTGMMDEGAIAKILDRIALESAIAMPAGYIRSSGADEMELAILFATILQNPAEGQGAMIETALATLKDADQFLQGEGAKEIQMATDRMIQIMTSVLAAQAIPGLLKEGDIESIRAIFKELNVERGKIIISYQETIKPYYDKMKKIFIRNISVLQLNNLLSKGMMAKEIEDMPNNDIDKILEKLKNAKDKTFEEDYILQEEAKCRKQYLGPGKKELADRMKQMLDRFTSRIGGVINTEEGKK